MKNSWLIVETSDYDSGSTTELILNILGKTVMLACGGGTVQKSGGGFDMDFTKGFFFILHEAGIIRYAG